MFSISYVPKHSGEKYIKLTRINMALYSNGEFTVVISAFKKLHSDEELNENLKKRKVM